MISTRPATASETETWLSQWRDRWESEHARTRTEPHTDARMKRHTGSPDATVLRLLDDGVPVGFLALSTVSDFGAPSAILDDIYVDEAHRRRGIGTAAVQLAEDWARPRSGRLRARVAGVDPAQLGLVRGFTPGGQSMIKDLTGPPALPAGVSVRPMTQAEYEPWYDHMVLDYAQSFVDSGILEPAEARVRATEQSAQLLSEGLATPGHEILTLLADGETAGTIWLHHGVAPDTSYVYGVDVDEDKRGRGLGRAVMYAGEVASLAAGDHRLGLFVFGHNTVAVRLYESLGYQVVDQGWSITF
jgi:GNAT superfamily N-acetyltransferase